MQFKRQSLELEGFRGFLTTAQLRGGRITDVPIFGGAYAVLREMDSPPTLLDKNPGGRFKGKDPTVTRRDLVQNWVTGAHVIYIGKGDELQRRIKQFLDFGEGKPVGHWGGRLVWQIENSSAFVVAWKEVGEGEEPADLESRLLADFKQIYGRLPFANLRE